MKNPFEDLGKKAEIEESVEVSGTFECQEHGCYEETFEAMYFVDRKLLTWAPPCGHIGKVEDFQLD